MFASVMFCRLGAVSLRAASLRAASLHHCRSELLMKNPHINLTPLFTANMSKLFVYGINADCPERLLREVFESAGDVEEINNTQRGYAFITMADKSGAEAACSDLNGTEFNGQTIKVEHAKQRDPNSFRENSPMGNRENSYQGEYNGGKLFVYGVNPSVSESELRNEFEKAGEVAEVFNTEKGYAFVTMADRDGAEAACSELNGREFNGQMLKVNHSKPRESRDAWGVDGADL